MDRMISVYIHIPFCIKKCGYCDFLSFSVRQYRDQRMSVTEGDGGEGVPEEYLHRLRREIRREGCAYAGRKVDTVFIGGGTPSLMMPEQAETLLKEIYQSFQVVSDAEITMEANPGTLTKEKLKGYRRIGVNRLSIGLQSADDQELEALGRIHKFREFQENYEAARDCGFRNINIDLMSGLPGQTVKSWIHTLDTAVKCAPEHISAYGLIIEEGTPFYQRYGMDGTADRDGYKASGEERNREAGKKRQGQLPSEEAERLMYHETKAVLEEYGYRQYEISNYAKPGFECRHNIGYWTRKEYVGFGPGAASMICNQRWKNTSDLKKYMKCTDSRDETGRKNEIWGNAVLLKEDMQTLTVQEQMEETMFLGLRMNRGVSKTEFKELYGVEIKEVYGAWLCRMAAEGLLIDGDSVCLSERGRDLANYVMAGFLLD